MEETLEGGRGPPRAVAPLERERERILQISIIRFSDHGKFDYRKEERR
jgi:hypothetical protein